MLQTPVGHRNHATDRVSHLTNVPDKVADSESWFRGSGIVSLGLFSFAHRWTWITMTDHPLLRNTTQVVEISVIWRVLATFSGRLVSIIDIMFESTKKNKKQTNEK